MTRQHRVLATLLCAGLAAAASLTVRAQGVAGATFREAYGPHFNIEERAHLIPGAQLRDHGSDPRDTLRYWNAVAVDASGLDHTPPAPGEARTFGEQLGPGRSSRAMAIVHIALFDAINALTRTHRGYTDVVATHQPASMSAAIAQAARDTLAALYPSQRATFDALLARDLDTIGPASAARRNGAALGASAAAAILALRAGDGSQHAEPRLGVDYFPSDAAGAWRQDPVGQSPLALGAHWGAVKPFVLRAGDQFRAAQPPSMDSAAYTAAFDEVKRLGGDGIGTPTARTAEQTHVAVYWAYDGTPSLCAPPRLYNQIATQIAAQRGAEVVELARMLALVNVAMADAGTAVWESKYFYRVWRPVTGVREADAGTGPTGAGDGNAATTGDPSFTPLGAPASNFIAHNFTPPFPSYPSGHAGFGGALFEMLRNVYGTDRIAFTFVSDEFNGTTRDNAGNVRPLLPRSFDTLSQAEEENGQSRIYLGIHWAFDKTAGIAQGRQVADYVFAHAFQPRRGDGDGDGDD